MSEADRVAVVERFLLSSPPGEIKAVAADMEKFLGADAVPAHLLVPTFRQYNLTNAVVVTEPGSEAPIILAHEGEIGEGVFVDTKRKVLVRVSHVEQKVTETLADAVPPSFFDATVEALRLSVVDALSKDRLNRSAMTSGFEVYSKEARITIVKSALSVNLRNMWAGQWRSRWTVSLTSPSSAAVTGSTHIATHYFENGNLQMNSDRSYTTAVTFTDPASFGAAVAAYISAQEDGLQSALEELFERMGLVLKDIRRVLPYSQKKMEWNPAAHRMTKTLRK